MRQKPTHISYLSFGKVKKEKRGGDEEEEEMRGGGGEEQRLAVHILIARVEEA